jgi:hypothetical protein
VRENIAVLDDGDFGRLVPLAVFRDVGIGAHGAEDVVEGDVGGISLFENSSGDVAKIAEALSE